MLTTFSMIETPPSLSIVFSVSIQQCRRVNGQGKGGVGCLCTCKQVKEKLQRGSAEGTICLRSCTSQNRSKQTSEVHVKKKTLTHYTPGNVLFSLSCAAVLYFSVLLFVQAPNCITLVEFDRFVFSLLTLQQLRGQWRNAINIIALG